MAPKLTESWMFWITALVVAAALAIGIAALILAVRGNKYVRPSLRPVRLGSCGVFLRHLVGCQSAVQVGSEMYIVTSAVEHTANATNPRTGEMIPVIACDEQSGMYIKALVNKDKPDLVAKLTQVTYFYTVGAKNIPVEMAYTIAGSAAPNADVVIYTSFDTGVLPKPSSPSEALMDARTRTYTQLPTAAQHVDSMVNVTYSGTTDSFSVPARKLGPMNSSVTPTSLTSKQ